MEPINLKFGSHSQQRMLDRGITIDQVKSAMRNPSETKNAPGGGKKAVLKVGKKTLVVVYSKEGFRDKKNTYFIITAYYEN